MRAAHRLKLTLEQLKAEASAKGEGSSGQAVLIMDRAGVDAIDALAVELMGQIERVHATEAVQDIRERAAQLQNLFDNALREGGNALIAARDECTKPILHRLGVQMPATAMLERLEFCAREQRAKILLAVRTHSR